MSWFAGVLCVFICTASLQGQSRESVLEAVGAAPSWTPSAKPSEYNEASIEKLAGKERAPLINSYGLIGATVQDWSGPGGKVRLTLFEMLDSAAGYGLFTVERNSAGPSAISIPVGAEGFRDGNRSWFWQSNYAVRLEGNTAASDALARITSEQILGKSQKPTVCMLLPPQYLVGGSETYIVDPAGLDRDLGLDTASLGFDSSVEIATARYAVNGKSADLVLLLYPTQQIAKKYADQWDVTAPDQSPFRKRVSRLVALVRGSSDTKLAETILGPVNNESQVTWNSRLPDIFLPEMILTIFTFIGLALLFTVVVGISFGGLRIFVKWKYPDRVFDRPQDMEIIQLKLGQGFIRKEIGK